MSTTAGRRIMGAMQVVVAILSIAIIAFDWRAMTDRSVDSAFYGVAAFLTLVVLLGQVAGGLVGRAGHRGIGLVVQAVAITTPLGMLRGLAPPLYIVWLATLTWPAFLILAVPSRTRSRRAAWLPLVTLVACPLGAATVTFLAMTRAAGWSWDAGPIGVSTDPIGRPTQVLYGLALAILAATAFDDVWRGPSRPPRSARAHRPIRYAGGVWLAATVVLLAICFADGMTWVFTSSTFLTSIVQFLVVVSLLAGVTWALALSALVQRFEQDEPTTLLTPAGLSRDLRRALADPSAKLVFADPGTALAHDRWIDDDGEPTALAQDDPERAIVVLERDGVVLGAIECDASLGSEPETIELVAAVAVLSVDASQHVAMAKARAQRARELTARLVETADLARHQLREQLLAGPLPELVAVEDGLRSGGDAAACAATLRAVAEQVRGISHGLFPPELEAGGLAVALPVVSTVPVCRLPAAIEVTAFIAANGDPHATLVAEDHRLVVTLSHVPTDPILRDRVLVLGGTIEGTSITLPMGS